MQQERQPGGIDLDRIHGCTHPCGIAEQHVIGNGGRQRDGHDRDRGARRHEPLLQNGEVEQFAVVENGVECCGQFSLAGPIVRQRQKVRP